MRHPMEYNKELLEQFGMEWVWSNEMNDYILVVVDAEKWEARDG